MLDIKNTLVFFNDGKILIRSTAVLTVMKTLPYPWRLLGIFTIVPVFLRDAVYKFIASNRYRWFGKSQYCSWDIQKYPTIFLP
jgi:predicted DCC family thiol-disulfide oxidoreductase YuxK